MKDGPRTPDDRARSADLSVPPERIKRDEVLNVTTAQLTETRSEVSECLETRGARVALPAPKDRDTFYSVLVHGRRP